MSVSIVLANDAAGFRRIGLYAAEPAYNERSIALLDVRIGPLYRGVAQAALLRNVRSGSMLSKKGFDSIVVPLSQAGRD
jgi:hypothetical protein